MGGKGRELHTASASRRRRGARSRRRQSSRPRWVAGGRRSRGKTFWRVGGVCVFRVVLGWFAVARRRLRRCGCEVGLFAVCCCRFSLRPGLGAGNLNSTFCSSCQGPGDSRQTRQEGNCAALIGSIDFCLAPSRKKSAELKTDRRLHCRLSSNFDNNSQVQHHTIVSIIYMVLPPARTRMMISHITLEPLRLTRLRA